jgi:hypothetical protein
VTHKRLIYFRTNLAQKDVGGATLWRSTHTYA